MSFSENLKHIRDELGWSQEKFGQLTGFSRATVACWETNVHDPSVANVQRLATLLEVSPDVLFSVEMGEPGGTIDDAIEYLKLRQEAAEHNHEEFRLGEESENNLRDLVLLYNRLNSEGQEMILNLARGLDVSGNYKREEEGEASNGGNAVA